MLAYIMIKRTTWRYINENLEQLVTIVGGSTTKISHVFHIYEMNRKTPIWFLFCLAYYLNTN